MIEKEEFADAIQRLENAFPGWKLSLDATKFWKRELEARGFCTTDLKKAVDRAMTVPFYGKGPTFPDLLKICTEERGERIEREWIEKKRQDDKEFRRLSDMDMLFKGYKGGSQYTREVCKATIEFCKKKITREQWQERLKSAESLKEGK